VLNMIWRKWVLELGNWSWRWPGSCIDLEPVEREKTKYLFETWPVLLWVYSSYFSTNGTVYFPAVWWLCTSWSTEFIIPLYMLNILLEVSATLYTHDLSTLEYIL
jgi:hypothetical protein